MEAYMIQKNKIYIKNMKTFWLCEALETNPKSLSFLECK